MVASQDKVFELLQQVKDPEIPSISVVELGVVREVDISESEVSVKITPTYSGCPALHVMEGDIVRVLNEAGFKKVKVDTVYAPAWSTNWISDEAKLKLKSAGIAPPTGNQELVEFPKQRKIPCPFCDSKETILKSEFGSTACKALYFCNSCQQPFDHFKDF